MYNLDDKDLDRLSQAAAENYKAPEAPSWETLQRTLDIELPQKEEKRRRGFLLFFLLLGLVGSGGLFWYYHQKNMASDKPISTYTKETPQAGARPITTSPATLTTSPANLPANRNKRSVEKQPANKSTELPTRNEATLPALTSKRNTAIAADNTIKAHEHQPKRILHKKEILPPFAAATNQKHPLIAKKVTGKVTRNKSALFAPRGNAGKVENTNQDDELFKTMDEQSSVNPVTGTGTLPATASIQHVDPLLTGDTAQTSKPVADAINKKDVANDDNKKKKISKNEKAFSAALLMGADLSTVEFTHTDHIGFNFGLLGGYHFNKYWSVHTGLIYTKKNYSLFGYDFHPPQPYSNAYMQSVEGYCYMWELPLMIRYTFPAASNHHFFVSTGLSSYFMNREHYDYYLKPGNNPSSFSRTYNEHNSYMLSILHLSAGFEKKMGKHLNWQIEPFAKIPLQGIGYGNLILNSFGINFSLQVKQPLKK